jgi:hypothetical protein
VQDVNTHLKSGHRELKELDESSIRLVMDLDCDGMVSAADVQKLALKYLVHGEGTWWAGVVVLFWGWFGLTHGVQWRCVVSEFKECLLNQLKKLLVGCSIDARHGLFRIRKSVT